MFRLTPDITRNRPIILAVSGGPDSMAMVGHALDWLKHNPERPIRAVIVDHGIRDGSDDEARLVKSWLDAMGIASRIATVDDNPPENGVQSWAREQRYRLLADDARRDNAVVITAHHADDQAETVAMRLAAGSGLGGLGGMRHQSQREDMTILRPFLDMTREELRGILEEQHIPYVEDPSNHNEGFDRIAWRVRLPALHGEGVPASDLLRLGDASSRLYKGLVSSIRDVMQGHWGVAVCGALWLNKQAVLALPINAAITLLRSIGGSRGYSRWPVRHDAVKTLLSALMRQSDDGVVMTLAGLEWYCQGDVIWVYPEAERPAPIIPVTNEPVFFDGLWQIRSMIEGDIEPLGEMRAALLRKSAPKETEELTVCHIEGNFLRAPMRALWRLPVLKPQPKQHHHRDNLSDQLGLITLEDGAIIPHLSNVLNFDLSLSDRIIMYDCRDNELI